MPEDMLDSREKINEALKDTGLECRTFAIPWGGGNINIWRQFYIAARSSGTGINGAGKDFV